MVTLGSQAAEVETRLSQGNGNLQQVVSNLDGRLTDNEKKLTDALTALSSTMTGFRSGFEQRLAASEARMDMALLVGAIGAGTGVPSPAPPPPPGQAGGWREPSIQRHVTDQRHASQVSANKAKCRWTSPRSQRQSRSCAPRRGSAPPRARITATRSASSRRPSPRSGAAGGPRAEVQRKGGVAGVLQLRQRPPSSRTEEDDEGISLGSLVRA